MTKKESGTVTGKRKDWITLCQLASFDDFVFRSFRQFNITKLVVDGYPKSATFDYLLTLKKHKDFGFLVNLWGSIDNSLKPETFIKHRGNNLSPATGRYIVNVCNYIRFFGESILNKSICEIGAGWGGEMIAFNKIRKRHFPKETGDADYTIFDLTSSKELIRRVANENGCKCKFNRLEDIENRSFDLVFSNGAFSEMGRALNEEYFEKIIKNSKRGYFICNFDVASVTIGGWDTEYFLTKLKKAGKKPRVLNIKKEISEYEDLVCNKLIVFGEDLNLGKVVKANKVALKIYRFLEILGRINDRIKQLIVDIDM